MQHYHINAFDEVIEQLYQAKTKLIYIAGASASGKSYFTHAFAEKLREKGHSVLEITSDDYYTDSTGLKFVIYGTFDHPNLIEYDLLQKNIDEYMQTGKTRIPKYSFKERRRVGHTMIDQKYDYVIVEGLYTISQLDKKNNPLSIFVNASLEELIFRRLIRDQERVSEPLDMILTSIGKVFPMWKLYGQPQLEKSDAVIDNDYQVLSKNGKKYIYEFTELKRSDFGELVKREYVNDFIYDDLHEGNHGCVIISETTRDRSGFLDYVTITKKKMDDFIKNMYTTISIDLFQPGILTTLHTLLQTAGLHYLRSEKKILSTYKKDGEEIVVKEVRGKSFIKKELPVGY